MKLQKKSKKIHNSMIKKNLLEHKVVLSKILNNQKILSQINQISEDCINAIKNKKKILLLGNGGSASDAMHITAELIGRFKKERVALPAIDLVSNSSTITALANDYNYKKIFSRQLQGVGNQGDILICISTSGLSQNVIEAIKIAKKKLIKTIVLTGNKKNNLYEFNGLKIVKVPSKSTARIQEMHILIGHIICEVIEKYFYNEKIKYEFKKKLF